MNNKILFTIILSILLTPTFALSSECISVASYTGTIKSYKNYIECNGGDPLAINDYGAPGITRTMLSILILVQALHVGDFPCEMEFKNYPNSGRAISEVKKGNVTLLAEDMWKSNFDESVYMTAPLIRAGEFEKGIYVKKDSHFLNTTTPLKSLKDHVPLVGNTWTTDIDLLREMGFTQIETAPRYNQIFKMMGKGRADFSLIEFPNRDNLSQTVENVELHPIPNAKIAFADSRNFMVSKKHPQGKTVYTALEKGMKILRENGTIDRALRQSGVINDRIKDWAVIYP